MTFFFARLKSFHPYTVVKLQSTKRIYFARLACMLIKIISLLCQKCGFFFRWEKIYLRTQCGTSAFKHATPAPMCAVNLPLLNLMVHKNIFRSVILKWSCPSCQLVHHPSSKRNLQFFSQNQAYYNLSFVLFLSCHNCVKNRHNCSVSILGYLNNCVLCTFLFQMQNYFPSTLSLWLKVTIIV